MGKRSRVADFTEPSAPIVGSGGGSWITPHRVRMSGYQKNNGIARCRAGIIGMAEGVGAILYSHDRHIDGQISPNGRRMGNAARLGISFNVRRRTGATY